MLDPVRKIIIFLDLPFYILNTDTDPWKLNIHYSNYVQHFWQFSPHISEFEIGENIWWNHNWSDPINLILMSLAAHQFGRVELWIWTICCRFNHAGRRSSKKQNKYSKFNTFESLSAKDINLAYLWLGTNCDNIRTHIGHNYVKLGCQTKHYENIYIGIQKWKWQWKAQFFLQRP